MAMAARVDRGRCCVFRDGEWWTLAGALFGGSRRAIKES